MVCAPARAAGAPPGPIAPSVAGRLAARARQHGSVLVAYGPWRGADVVLQTVRGVWRGLSEGRGRLRTRELTTQEGIVKSDSADAPKNKKHENRRLQRTLRS